MDPGDESEPGFGAEDGPEHDFRAPLPPEDRLWRHPSEVAAGARGAPAPSGPLATTARGRLWTVAAISALIGATASIGLAVAFGLVPTRTRVVERAVAVPPVEGAEGASRAEASLVGMTATVEGTERVGNAVVLRSDGYLVTVAHLIEGADAVTVWTDGAPVPAEVVGIDASTDIAVLHVDETLVPMVVGSMESVEVGDTATFVGMGLGHAWEPSTRAATVTALGKRLQSDDGATYHGMTLVDADADAGTAGCVLLDAQGAVVALASGRRADDDGADRAVVVPIELAVHVADQLIEHGTARHAWLGIEGRDADDDDLDDTTRAGAVRITGIVDDGPADRIGLREGDLITAIDGTATTSMSALIAALHTRLPGDRVVLDVRRDGTSMLVEVELVERAD